MKKNISAWMIFGLKIAITIGLVAYLLGKVDLAPVLAQIRSMQPLSAAIAFCAIAFQLALVSVRWQLVNRLVDARMPFGQVFRLTLVGQFFNQVLPTAVGGDAIRAWLASREGVPFGRAVTGILCDRAVALIVLALIISCSFFVFPSMTAGQAPISDVLRDVLGLIALAALLGLAGFFVFGESLARLLMSSRVTRPMGRLASDLRKVLYSSATSACIVGFSTAVQFLLVVAIYFCAKAMSIPLNFGPALLIVPAIMLVSMIPVSYGGWGVREGAMIVGLGLLRVTPGDALAVSVAYGLMQMVLGLPGGVLWLARTGQGRSTAVHPQRIGS